MKKILIRNGQILAGLPPQEMRGDILIADGKIEEIGIGCNASDATVLDGTDKLILPGLIDTHTHYLNSTVGHKMLVAAGVTTALDALIGQGEIIRMTRFLRSHPVGINSLFLFLLSPGSSVADTNPSSTELRDAMEYGINKGAFGVKIIGGHRPLTPDATARAISLAAKLKIPLMLHAGSTVNTDDFNGLIEAVSMADGNPMHLAHVNSYCTGKIRGNVLDETSEAIKLLCNHPKIVCESSLSNRSCIGASMINGIPQSLSMINKLKELGYAATYNGLKKSIADGVSLVSGQVGEMYRFLDVNAGLKLYCEKEGQVTIGFPANFPVRNIAFASAKRENGEFVVNALATDGGVIPRNTTLSHGLAAVESGFFTLSEFILKASYNGAKMLGLEKNKGYLSVGADADIIIVDPVNRRPEVVINSGNIIFEKDRFFDFTNHLYSLKEGEYDNFSASGSYPKWIM